MLANNIQDSSEDYTFLNTDVKSKTIESLTIHTDGSAMSSEYDSIDCSSNQDGSVMCYLKESSEDTSTNTKYYEFHISANGEIYTPFDSMKLFNYLGYDKLETLDLTGINTKYTIDMSGMFQRTGYTLMIALNLRDKFDTSNVTNIFSGCGKQNNTMILIVPNASLQTKILNLGTDNIPNFWDSNVVQVQSN